MAEVMVAVDGARVVTPPTFQGCGTLSVTERTRNRQGVIDAQTGEVSSVPEPAPAPRTHLASRLVEPGPTTATPTGPIWGHEQLAGEGPLRWRRRLQRENRDLVIVFAGQHYGIFHAAELLVLAGVRVRDLPPHRGSRDDILRRYGCLPATATAIVAPAQAPP